MDVSSKVTDDNEGSVMEIALGSLRARKIPMVKVNGLSWILDQNCRPAIVVGYGTEDPEKMSSIHHIIKFHHRKVAIFNVVSAMEDYAVKHTRVATPNIVIFDERIPAADPRTAREYLDGQYINHVMNVAEAFRDRGLIVPFIDGFEEEKVSSKSKGKAKAVVQAKGKVTKVKATKKPKIHKHVGFIVEEHDEEDGPVRRLTPIRTQPIFQGKSQTRSPSADDSSDQSSPDRADSIMGESGLKKSSITTTSFTFKNKPAGLAMIGSDTPISSVEEHGLQSPVSSVDGNFDDIEMLAEDDWSLSVYGNGVSGLQPC